MNTQHPGTLERTGTPGSDLSTGTSHARVQALPVCDPRHPDESMPEYAARCLRFLLAENVTATLTDEQLAQADCAAQRAAAQLVGQDGKASQLDTAQLLTLDRLTSARHLIARIIAWRAEMHRAACQDDPGRTIYPVGGAQGGRPAPLQPAPPSLPPAPVYANKTDPQLAGMLGALNADAVLGNGARVQGIPAQPQRRRF